MARSLIALAALACVPVLAGCSSGAAGEVKLGVDVAAIRTTANQTAADGSSADLVLDRVRILVATAKIGYINEQATGPSAEVGPYVIDLTADEIANGAHREISLGALETGTYGGAEIEIEPLDADDAPSGDELADFLSSGASVIVDGTYQGASFQFAGHFLAGPAYDGVMKFFQAGNAYTFGELRKHLAAVAAAAPGAARAPVDTPAATPGSRAPH